MDTGQALRLSFNNRWQQKDYDKCGCYHCCKTFNSCDITLWYDEGTTAACPECEVDAILFGITDAKTLKACGDELFKF